MKLVLPFPPSVNTLASPNKGPLKDAISSAPSRAYQSAACGDYRRTSLRPNHQTAPAAVDIFHPPANAAAISTITTRRCLRAAAGIWEDDSQVKRMLVEWAPQVPGGKVEITIASYVENGRQNSNALVRA
jgi:crossover junction endodeoxyribonuclease RusA